MVKYYFPMVDPTFALWRNVTPDTRLQALTLHHAAKLMRLGATEDHLGAHVGAVSHIFVGAIRNG